MKVHTERTFRPVTVVIETVEELDALINDLPEDNHGTTHSLRKALIFHRNQIDGSRT